MTNAPQNVGCRSRNRPANLAAGIGIFQDDVAAGSEEARGALSALAKSLHAKMERLDPSDGVPWEALTDHEKRFYELCVEEVISDREMVASAYAVFSLPATTR